MTVIGVIFRQQIAIFTTNVSSMRSVIIKKAVKLYECISNLIVVYIYFACFILEG